MKNILVVDDSGLIRLKISNLLKEEGFNVFEAVNLSQAENYIISKEDYNIELVLLDIYLEEENGLNLFSFLKKQHMDIPVIVTSSESKSEVVKEALQLGAKDYILKPFDKNYLLSRVNNYIYSESKEKIGTYNQQKEAIKIYDREEVYAENFSSFKTNLSLEINRSIRSKLPITLLKFIIKQDLPNNELNKTKDIVTSEIRDIDQMYIITNRKVLMLLPITDKDGGKVLVKRLKTKIEQIIENIEDSIEYSILSFPDEIDNNIDIRNKEIYVERYLKSLEMN